LSWAAVACAGALPGPPLAPQPESAFAPVPYPPPAARVETIPRRPTAHAVCVDGQWTWDGRQWVWLPGGWLEPAAGARFSTWALRRMPDGRLQFAPAAWRDARGQDLPSPRVLAGALGENATPLLPTRSP
jgi:hypothetical protein